MIEIEKTWDNMILWNGLKPDCSEYRKVKKQGKTEIIQYFAMPL